MAFKPLDVLLNIWENVCNESVVYIHPNKITVRTIRCEYIVTIFPFLRLILSYLWRLSYLDLIIDTQTDTGPVTMTISNDFSNRTMAH